MKTAHRLIRHVINGEKPVIAAVEGFAFGAGLSLAAASDYAVVAENAKLCASFARVGLIPDMGLYYSLAQRVGVPVAKRMAVLAEVVEGAEAVAIGLADRVVPAGATLDAAMGVARDYVQVAPIPLALTKAVFANGAVSLEQALTAEVDYQLLLFGTADHRDAAKAFMEKRKTVFQGR
jgi:2-(1,2-epoxy-1,2-dihydrophenyl)acetyl-CoA isomerase